MMVIAGAQVEVVQFRICVPGFKLKSGVRGQVISGKTTTTAIGGL